MQESTQVHDTGNATESDNQSQPQPAQGSSNDRQVGGGHYKQFAYEPWDVILNWGLGYLDGNVVKYISRWRHKNGLEDLKKARHYIDKLIEVESARAK